VAATAAVVASRKRKVALTPTPAPTPPPPARKAKSKAEAPLPQVAPPTRSAEDEKARALRKLAATPHLAKPSDQASIRKLPEILGTSAHVSGLGAAATPQQVNASRFVAADAMWLVTTDATGKIVGATAFSQILGVSAGFNPLVLVPDGARIGLDGFMVPSATGGRAAPTLPWLIPSDRYDDIAGFGTYGGLAVVWDRGGKPIAMVPVATLSRRGNPLPGHRGRRLDLKRTAVPKPHVLTAKQIAALHDVPDRDAVEYRRTKIAGKKSGYIVGYDADGKPVASTREVVVTSEGDVKHWEGVNVTKRLPHGNVGEGDRFWVMALDTATVVPTAPVPITEKAWNALPAPWTDIDNLRKGKPPALGRWHVAVFQRKPWVSEKRGANAYGVLFLDGAGIPINAASKDRMWHKQDGSLGRTARDVERAVEGAVQDFINWLMGEIFTPLGRAISGELGKMVSKGGLEVGLGLAIARNYGGGNVQALQNTREQGIAQKLLNHSLKPVARRGLDNLGDEKLTLIGSATMPMLAPIFIAMDVAGRPARLNDIPGWGTVRNALIDAFPTVMRMVGSGQAEEVIARVTQVAGAFTFGTSTLIGTAVEVGLREVAREVATRAGNLLVGGKVDSVVSQLTKAGIPKSLAEDAVALLVGKRKGASGLGGLPDHLCFICRHTVALGSDRCPTCIDAYRMRLAACGLGAVYPTTWKRSA